MWHFALPNKIRWSSVSLLDLKDNLNHGKWLQVFLHFYISQIYFQNNSKSQTVLNVSERSIYLFWGNSPQMLFTHNSLTRIQEQFICIMCWRQLNTGAILPNELEQFSNFPIQQFFYFLPTQSNTINVFMDQLSQTVKQLFQKPR